MEQPFQSVISGSGIFFLFPYREERKNNIIMLEKEGTDEPAWFILRIHNEEIEKMGGGSYKKLEEGVWLIQADSNNVILNLKSSETQKYY